MKYGATRYFCDRNNNFIKEINPYGYEKETDNGTGTVYTYDNRGNRVKETNGLGQVVTENSYNLQNMLQNRKDGLGNETDFAYTLDGQIGEVRRGTKRKQPLQTYEYNTRGQITTEINFQKIKNIV